MKRGTLRVFLGAAPGVGKTFAMLEEGHRLREEGQDVVVASLDDKGRSDIVARAAGLERAPGDTRTLALGTLLARHPDVVLVDELTLANGLDSSEPTRWAQVESLLTGGIDVLTTLNIQNLASLNDVVFEITGVREPATIADEVLRQTAEIEVVDLAEERLRERLHAGKIYPAEQLDAKLANYFRPGNLSALRELTLSWAADRVDEDLVRYRALHGIEDPWPTKERIVVWLSGEEGGEVVVRRAARSSLRTRADLIGVFIRRSSGSEDRRAPIGTQRELLESLGGVYHEVVGEGTAGTLLAFASAENATRVFIGAPHRSRMREWWTDATVAAVIRNSGKIEVSVISYESARTAGIRPRRRISALSTKRVLLAWLLAAAVLPATTILLLSLEDRMALENVLLVYLLIAVGVGTLGGALPAVVSAIAGFLLANWYFTPPFLTWKISDAGHLFALFAFLVVASAVGLLVGNATRRSAEARKARAQTDALAASTTSQHDPPDQSASGLTTRIRDVFAMSAAAVLRKTGEGWEPIATVGVSEITDPDQADEVIPLTDDSVLALSGGNLTGDDRRVLRAFAAQMAQALDRERLETQAAAAGALVETDRLRTALLDAVSHDLRTPLATIKASVTSLLETGVSWSDADTKVFLRTILAETEHLNRLVGRLLDASRIQLGAVPVFSVMVGLEEVVSAALTGLKPAASLVRVDIPERLPPVETDPALLERVVANLVENALAWSSPDTPVVVTAGEVAGRIDLRIIDRGPGIHPDVHETIFQPFQRFGDSANGSGVGLGLAVARGFVDAMGNSLTIEDTPGGGTTMVIGFETLPLAASTVAADDDQS